MIFGASTTFFIVPEIKLLCRVTFHIKENQQEQLNVSEYGKISSLNGKMHIKNGNIYS